MPTISRVVRGVSQDRYGVTYNYREVSSGFKGLLTSIDPSLSAGEYLADMRNVIIVNGTLRSINKPAIVSAGSGAVNSIARPFNRLMIVRNGVMTDFGSLDGPHVTPVVYYAGKRYWMRTLTGLCCDTGIIAPAWDGIETDPGCYDFNAVAAYGDRLYTSHGSYIRFNNPGDASLSANWTGDYVYNIIRMHQGGAVHFMFPMNSGLLIILYGSAYVLTDPFSGGLQCVYMGGGLPTFIDKTVQPYCDGSTLYYCQSDGMYTYTSSGVQKISAALGFDADIHAYYVGEYLNRVWFLACSGIHSTDSSPNYIYALEKTDGIWEKYDFGHALLTQDYLTAIHGAGDYEPNGEKGLYLGINTGNVEKWKYVPDHDDCEPWSITTRCYQPDENELIHFGELELDYIGGNADGMITIQTILDGQLIDTKNYPYAAGRFLHHETYTVTCRHTDGSLPSTCQFVISGATPMQIGRIAVNFKPRSKGADFDVDAIA